VVDEQRDLSTGANDYVSATDVSRRGVTMMKIVNFYNRKDT
jgi:hypothetical protein